MGKLFLNTIIISCAAFFVQACGNAKQEVKAEEKPVPSVSSDYEIGLALVAQSDCLTCHKVDEKNIGPAYREIAAKYDSTKENIELLAGKIRKGGSGVWGTIPMTPHPQLSEEDAKAMVRYIFTLKN
jgi:cytochrome c